MALTAPEKNKAMSTTPQDTSKPTTEVAGPRILLSGPALLGFLALFGASGCHVVENVFGGGLGFGVLIILGALTIVRGIATMDNKVALALAERDRAVQPTSPRYN